MNDSTLGFIAELEATIRERIHDNSDESYTASLARSGTKRVAQKTGEEAVELALAAVAGDNDEVQQEAADLVYHLLVLLALNDLSISDVVQVLRERHAG